MLLHVAGPGPDEPDESVPVITSSGISCGFVEMSGVERLSPAEGGVSGVKLSNVNQ